MQAREEIIRGVLDIDDIKLLDSVKSMICPRKEPEEEELTDEELREAIREGAMLKKESSKVNRHLSP